MKKLIALALAAAMVMGLGMVSFAALDPNDKVDYIDDTPRLEESGEVSDKTVSSSEPAPYGKTVYYELRTKENKPVVKSDAIQNISIKKSWDNDGSLVSGVSIVRKSQSYAGSPSSRYYLAIKIKSSSSTSNGDVYGTITIKKSGSNGFDEKTLDVSLPVGYAYATDKTITETAQIFNYSSSGDNQLDPDTEDVFEIDGIGTFTVNTKGQGKIVLAMDQDYDVDIANNYPNANDLNFFNGNGAQFNKTGEMALEYDEDYYLYEITGSSTLKKINADYDGSAYVFKTNKLGRYLLSDVQLKAGSAASSSSSSSSSSQPSSSQSNSASTPVYVPVNPSTGAAA